MGKFGTVILLIVIGYVLGAMFPGPFNSVRATVGV